MPGLARALVRTGGVGIHHDNGEVATQCYRRVGRGEGEAWGRANLWRMRHASSENYFGLLRVASRKKVIVLTSLGQCLSWLNCTDAVVCDTHDSGRVEGGKETGDEAGILEMRLDGLDLDGGGVGACRLRDGESNERKSCKDGLHRCIRRQERFQVEVGGRGDGGKKTRRAVRTLQLRRTAAILLSCAHLCKVPPPMQNGPFRYNHLILL